jgi:hypothetical protein
MNVSDKTVQSSDKYYFVFSKIDKCFCVETPLYRELLTHGDGEWAHGWCRRCWWQWWRNPLSGMETRTNLTPKQRSWWWRRSVLQKAMYVLLGGYNLGVHKEVHEKRRRDEVWGPNGLGWRGAANTRLSLVAPLVMFQSPISLFPWKFCVIFFSILFPVKTDKKSKNRVIQQFYSSIVRFRSKL